VKSDGSRYAGFGVIPAMGGDVEVDVELRICADVGDVGVSE
jgi:hypothetical protein